VTKFQLPSTEVRDAAWQDEPPGPLDDPALYDGLIWRRVAGYLIDAALLLMMVGALWVVNVLMLFFLTPVVLTAAAVLPLTYHTFFVGRNGATPGMHALDLEVRSWNGRRPDYPQAFILAVVFYVSVSFTAWLVLLVALFNDRHRTLHDLVAGTVALRQSRLTAASLRASKA